jgi:Phage Terminase
MAEAFADNALARWRADPAAFIERHLIDPETDKPFKLLDAERWFLKFALKLDDRDRLLYPELVYGAIKKSGKTGFAALFLLTLLLLYGGKYAEAYCVANDLEQAMSRVFEMVRRIVEASPLLRQEARITANRIVFEASGATITCLASDYASAAGGHPVISVFDEAWAYTSERSRRLYDELVPVPTRRISCRLMVTHAGFEGEGQLLQELYNRGLALPQVGTNLHAGDGLLMAWHHEPIAPWQTEQWLADMRRTLRPNQFLRMCENKFVTTESSFVDMAWWDACVEYGMSPTLVAPALPVWVGVDASVKHDSTAIVTVTFNKEAQKVALVLHRIFQPSPKEPLNFEETIERHVRELMKRFAVRSIHYDPFQMVAVAQRLQQAGAPMRECPQSSGYLTEVGSNLYELIKGRGLIVYPDPDVRLAISRAVAVETSRGWRLAKEKAAHRIDFVVALAMAAHAAMTRQWDEAPTSFPPPIWGGTPRSIPGQDFGVGASERPLPSAPAVAPIANYNYETQDDWKNYIDGDGNISMTPFGGSRKWWGPVGS